MTKVIKYINDLYPSKGQFIKNENIFINIEANNELDINLNLDIQVMHLNRVVYKSTETLKIPTIHNVTEIEIPSFDVDHMGYGLDIDVYDDNSKLVQKISSSFDVVDNWRRAPRYGFLSDFYTSEQDDTEDIKSLSKFHINIVQFYDWMYKHDNLIPPGKTYTDLMGRELNIDTVVNKIDACHNYNMKAIAYGAVYAASKDFYDFHRDWGLYNSNDEVINFIDIFRIMNIDERCGWHAHIIDEYGKAVKYLDFDGIHMDTYGFPKSAIGKLNGVDENINLENHFPILINNTRNHLSCLKDDICLIFNNVGDWPVDTVAKSEQDAMYIEVWDPYDRYDHLRQIIYRAKLLSDNKPVILAAYMKPYIDAIGDDREMANNATLLALASITSLGGYQLIMGELNGILTQGYYVDYTTLDTDFIARLRLYHDFIVRYSNLFFDYSLRDVSMTHMLGDNLEYEFHGIDVSPSAEANKVWAIIKESPDTKVISLVNLLGNDNKWNALKHAPSTVRSFVIDIQIDKEISDVYMISPDRDNCRPNSMDYTVIKGSRGLVARVTIRSLDIWSTLVLEF